VNGGDNGKALDERGAGALEARGLRAGNEVPQRRALRAAAIRLLKGKQRPLGNRLRVSAQSQPNVVSFAACGTTGLLVG
jgi:hypothetical protein